MGTLFDYHLTPTSVPAGAAEVTLTLKVSNETGSAQECKAIQLTLPAGLSDDLGSVGAAALSGTPWSIASEGGGVFQAEPQPPATGIGAGDAIGFTFSGIRASATPATLEVAVAEASGGGTNLPLTLAAAQLGITQFTATAVQVTPDTPVTLSWSAADASGCSLAWDRGHYDGGATGSYTDAPPLSTTYTLTASGTGQPVAAQLAVTVETPKIPSFGASPTNVAMGGDVILSWETVHAECITLAFHPDSGREPPVLDVPPRSSGYTVNPEVSGTYHLEAVGEGRTVSSDQPVTVEAVAIDSFSATPKVITPGGSSTLTWSTEWTSSCVIGPGLGSFGASGSTTVSPGSDTTYTLAASGLDPLDATAGVAIVPRITSFRLVLSSDRVQVWWTSMGGARAAIGEQSYGANDSATLPTNSNSNSTWTLTIASPLGATAAIEFAVATHPLQDGSQWPSAVTLTSYQAGGLNFPGVATVAWYDELPLYLYAMGEWVEGFAETAAGAESAIGSRTTQGFVPVYVAAPPANAPALWSAQAGDAPGEFHYWNVYWAVLTNPVAGG